jgi:cytohesin
MLTLAIMARGATNDLTGLLQQGLFEEEANRNLDAAISDYQSLASNFDKDRQLAATAIFRLGECYRKLGKTNEAVVQYQRIVKEFSDQQTLATLSRQNLAGLNIAPKAEDSGVSNTTLLDARANVASLQAQIQEVEKMSRNEKRVFVQQNFPNSVLTESMTQLISAERDLIKLKMDYTPDHPKYKSAQELVDDLNAKIDAQTDSAVRVLPDKLAAAQAKLNILRNVQSEFTAGGGTQESTTTDEEQREVRNIQAMIQNSPDLINAPDTDGKTPLQIAAEKGQLIVAKYLLDHGADVNAGSRRHPGNPLYGAAEHGHKAMVELLLSRGADVNAGVLDPLYRAISLGYAEVAEVLMANKADVNLKGINGDGQRPLHAAASNGKTSLVQLLINHGADVNATDNNGYTPLHSAATADALPAAKLLLASKVEVNARNKSGDTPLHSAAQQGNADVVSLLLDSGAAVDGTNHNNDTPLLLAVANGRAEATRILLTHKADPNHRGGVSQNEGNYISFVKTQPLFLKATVDNLEILKLLLDAGADPEGDSEQSVGALAGAISRNSADAVQLLLQHGANPNRPVLNGISPLDDAVANKRTGIVSLLLDKGADPNAKDSTDTPPLFHTTDSQIGHLLIDHKADVNAQTADGQTPLMRTDSTNYLQFLLEAGAKIDLQDTNGDTALHHAIYNSLPLGSIAILLEHKANPNIQNNNGSTPLDIVNGRIHQPGTPLRLFAPAARTLSIEDAKKIAEMLIQAGGLANLPKRDRIEVRRDSQTSMTYTKGSHDWNHYSLLELIAGNYALLSQNTSGEWRSSENWGPIWNDYLPFPNFKKVVIYRRVNNSAKQTAMNVDLEEILQTGDCSRDVLLQWGDIVEIPEADHPVDQHWEGLSGQEVSSLTKCVSRQVTVRIKGESTTLKLAPELSSLTIPSGPNGKWRRIRASFMLRSVLDNSKLLRVSSDLSHVKINRHDPVTKKAVEWVLDCTDPNQADLWLREGDVIDVPEK